jgi:succinate dehydrogenase/fumarate reductase flavoprotein subunit
LDVAIVKEVRAGRCTARKGIFVDFTGIDEALLSRSPRAREARQLLPLTRQWLKARHVDMDREPLEVAWFSHAINGGLRINERGETSVLGLLAAGEVAAGPHGADRLGGNMLVACQVFGRRSGRRAALLAKELPPAGNVPVVQGTARMWEERLASRDGEIKPADLKRHLQRMMYDTVLVLRSEETLTRSLQGIQEMRERARRGLRIEHVRDLCERQELENLLQVGEIVARAALLRRESRGSHYREDFPELDPKWGESIVSRRNGSALEQFRGKLSSC